MRWSFDDYCSFVATVADSSAPAFVFSFDDYCSVVATVADSSAPAFVFSFDDYCSVVATVADSSAPAFVLYGWRVGCGICRVGATGGVKLGRFVNCRHVWVPAANRMDLFVEMGRRVLLAPGCRVIRFCAAARCAVLRL